MKKIKKIWSGICVLALVFGLFVHPEIAKAATATVTFGSESYTTEADSQFRVGVYLEGDARIGSYHVELEYDENRMEYVSGAEAGGEGVVILEGTGTKQRVKYMLTFRSISGGPAYIRVGDTTIQVGENTDGDTFEITERDYADITIAGTDTVGEVVDENGFKTDIPHVKPTILLNGQKHYVVDVTKMMPANVNWNYEFVTLNFLNQQVTFLTDQNRNIYIAYLVDESETLKPYVYNPGEKMFYECGEYISGDASYIYVSASAVENWPDELTLDIVKKQDIVYSIDQMGNGKFSHLDENGILVEWDEKEAQQSTNKQNSVLIWIFVIATVILVLVVAGIFILNHEREKGEKQGGRQKYRQSEKTHVSHAVPILNLETNENILVGAEDSVKERPVISVQDVTMKFKISTSNVSGIKEFIIQLLKKEVTYRELVALNHVSFDIYKGEVVGVIGTNGSGKSTVLRIVSGALLPTDGRVVVDKKKVQLLSLGTGFDKELTAKENVYLNGALIGYSLEFIDAHYDEIVKFAELDGFMDEKVKNFSSGMVSRLGFAIATVGDNAEILILDEVLSVGDEFFRKKSLARVKEMIHSGATVLMVSHSMSTIKENCSKVVWIEKGVVKMIGPTEDVCTAYQKHHYKKAKN